MAAELEKLALDLKARGYGEGSQMLSSFARALHKGGLIPSSLNETRSERLESDLPPFVFDKPEGIPSYIYEIDALNLSQRTRNVLARAQMTSIRQVYDTPDSTLMGIRLMGKLGAAELRRRLSEFRERVTSERQRFGIEDDTPVRLPYPTE